MLRVTTTKEKRSAIWIPVIIATCAMHLGFFCGAVNWAKSRPRTPHVSSRIEFRAATPVTEPLGRPRTEKAPEPPPEEQKPEIEAVEKSPPKSPEPNTAKPKPPPKRAPSEPAKAVFGVTADSVTGSGSGVAVRVGNTLAKEMEREFTRPQEVKALPSIPKGPPAMPRPPVKKNKPVKPVPVYELSEVPSFKNKIEPKYPDAARRAGIEGVVQLEILIDENGRVRKVKVLKSPGHGLEQAAIAAVSKSRFNPGVINGKAVPVKIRIPYKFFLDA